ncbi:pentatricopeptide repeat-containing protein At3g62890-like [Cynara cardunculus var. scolymus]|uniref:Pentatricopeptide repeat-containing protein n=1 Tax=Cynara cardunculus var. scolymus TaxID=59895 RepID=A0A103YKX6_CYNCS|nr:pentatricopeptide repeat-containing protein At3g62890-like [Cynara cardunculus var. scolymus]KVI11029.1 Pentatricopeptide repeat-containing protein [Cynara cardunculus var. scolymus]
MKWRNLASQNSILMALLDPLRFQSIPSSSSTSYAPIFQFLTGLNLHKLGQQTHAHLILRGLNPNSFLGAKMVAMYASSGDIDSAIVLFDCIRRNASTLLYNSIIRACALYGLSKTSVGIYLEMDSAGVRADYFTFPFVLKSCADLCDVGVGRCVHGKGLRSGLEFDFYVGASLIDFYVKCGELGDARKLFDEMPQRDIASWNSLIAGHMKNGMVRAAEDLFSRMLNKNIVSWTTMISGYTQNGLADRALELFDEMTNDFSNIKPNWVTIMSILPACAQLSALDRGRKIHDYATSIGVDSNTSVQTALAAMYAKCGSLSDARICFENIPPNRKNLVSWNTMISAYASHGYGIQAISTFSEMIRTRVQPDAITFTGLLSGCSHSGLVDIGLNYFNSMRTEYNIEPTHEHYACTVDLLGRAGRLNEAYELTAKMPMPPGASIWGALLSASKNHRNLSIAEISAKNLFVLEPENSGNYVVLSNMYAEAGMWIEVKNLRDLLKTRGVKKNPGYSWIELDGKLHMFLGGDTSHSMSKEIYQFLAALPEKMKALGYVAETNFALHDVSEEEREESLASHSEKLAVGFGILCTSSGTVVRVTKNLRICGDCHTVMKFVSRIYGRQIVVRDVNRFHHFSDGSCSCRDYW